MSVDFLVKLRDAAQLMADAAEEYIQTLAPPEVKQDPKQFDSLFWETLNGAKGPFERTSKGATNNSPLFQTLQKLLKEHRGFMHFGDYTFWFDQGNPDVIDRRRK